MRIAMASVGRRLAAMCACVTALLGATGSLYAETGKLRLTGGVSTIDGAAGGGISPWALIGTQAAEGEWGANGFVSRVASQDYQLEVAGAAIAWNNRVEVSLARQRFATGPTGVALGLPGLRLQQNVAGVKLRVIGEAILDSDTWMPQVSVGLLKKSLDAGGLLPTLSALGAKTNGTDAYVSATKLFLAPGVLVNATLRSTQANQNGLLGFGSARESGRKWMPEVSIAKLLSPQLAVGIEYRKKPDNLNRILGPGVLAEQDWKDVFVAWAPHKSLSITAAYVELGQIAPPFVATQQSGVYLSVQAAF